MHDLQAYRGGKAAFLKKTFAKSRARQVSKYKHDLHLSVGQRLGRFTSPLGCSLRNEGRQSGLAQRPMEINEGANHQDAYFMAR